MGTVFTSSRDKLAAEYAQARKDFVAYTKPYKSSGQLQFDVVDPLPTVTPVMAHAVARKGSVISLFSYGLATPIPFAQAQRPAIASDTNVAKGSRTNGVEDVVIEGISLTCKGVRCEYAAGAYTGLDASCINAYIGQAAMGDPAGLAMPPQCDSPFNLEAMLWERCKPVLDVSFTWDRQRVIPIGTADEIPEGGAKSFLKSSGDPRTDNRYKIPEGYLWRQQGRPDSDFQVDLTLREDVVIPINLVALNGTTTPLIVPKRVYIDVSMRLHGLVLGLPSNN